MKKISKLIYQTWQGLETIEINDLCHNWNPKFGKDNCQNKLNKGILIKKGSIAKISTLARYLI